jgi:hypothetical protein
LYLEYGERYCLVVDVPPVIGRLKASDGSRVTYGRIGYVDVVSSHRRSAGANRQEHTTSAKFSSVPHMKGSYHWAVAHVRTVGPVGPGMDV